MLDTEIDEKTGIATLSPDDKLSEIDFNNACAIIDPYIEEHDRLNGLIISTRSFPGWESFSALLSHLSFVRDHHRKIRCVALVTDSPAGRVAEPVARHFVSAQVKVFQYGELASARQWIIASHDSGVDT